MANICIKKIIFYNHYLKIRKILEKFVKIYTSLSKCDILCYIIKYLVIRVENKSLRLSRREVVTKAKVFTYLRIYFRIPLIKI